MQIENTTWTIKELEIKKGLLNKPKFQRKLCWLDLPDPSNEKEPNNKEYIEFLIRNKNTVFPISLGIIYKDDHEEYIVIDGNNRVNCIIKFFDKPYKYFSEHFHDLLEIINKDNEIDIKIKRELINKIKNLSYEKLVSFRNLKKTLNLELDLSDKTISIIEDQFENIRIKFIYDDDQRYNNVIKININIFKNFSLENCSKIFEDINKRSNPLSDNELLSAILYNNNIVIINEDYKYIHDDIIKEITNFYNNDDKNDDKEIIEKYKYIHDEKHPENINVFDFFIGFQNYCSSEFNIIPKFTAKGTLSIFYKLYGLLFINNKSKNYNKNYNNENIDIFIANILMSCSILQNIINIINPSNINFDRFNKNHKSIKLSDNNIILILISLIRLNQNNMLNDSIIKTLKFILIYFFICDNKFIKYIDMPYDFTYYKKKCILSEYCCKNFDQNCYNIYNNKCCMFTDFDKLNFNEFIKVIIYNIYDNNLIKFRKRKDPTKITIIESILISNFIHVNNIEMFMKHNNIYTYSSIVPHNTHYDDKLNVNRLGNIIPIFDYIQSDRNNKDINYLDTIYPEYYNSIKCFVPKVYEDIVYSNYSRKNIKIISNDKFNEMCKFNEDLYVNFLLNY